MSKTSAIIAAALTVLLLTAAAILSILAQVLALNGASESQGTIALGTSLACQGMSILLCGALTMTLTRSLVEHLGWNKALAAAAAVAAGTALGLGLAFISILAGIASAGIS